MLIRAGICFCVFLVIVPDTNSQYENYYRPPISKRPPYRDQIHTTVLPLTNEEEEDHLKPLVRKGWELDKTQNQTRIKKDFIFQSFYGSFSFMTQIAMMSERVGHFPEWFNIYRVVKVTLTTRHLRTLSMKDIYLAQFADRIYEAQKDI